MDERLRRWRLVLGGDEADGTGVALSAGDARVDRALEAVYDADRTGGLARSASAVARWLGDIRGAFPRPVVRLLQRDAVERLELGRLLVEPELLDAMEPDLDLAVALLALAEGMPDDAREIARGVVRRVVEDLASRIEGQTIQEVRGALRGRWVRRPAPGDIDWDRTIRANLSRANPRTRVVVPERLVGRGRRARGLHDVVLLVDQSGSMAASLVHAAVAAAALAKVPSLRTRMLLFDTRVVDLSAHIADPVDLLFAAQLGGGTDIGGALAHAARGVDRPSRTVVVLISDLVEGRDPRAMVARARQLVADGVTLVALLALTDQGAPAYHHDNAVALASVGVPAFACTPDHLGELLAAAIAGRDLSLWASSRGVDVVR